MAQDSILSLFGPSPAQIQQQRQQEDLEFGHKAGGLNALMGYSGRQLGRSMAASPMFGGSDPELERATKIKAVTSQIQQSGIDPSNPDAVFPAMIQGFQQAGLTKEAMMAAQEYQKIRDEQTKLTNETTTADARMISAQAAWKKAQQENDPRIKSNLEFEAAAIELGIPAKSHVSEYTQPEVQAINALLQQRKGELREKGRSSTTVTVEGFDKPLGRRESFIKETKPHYDRASAIDEALVVVGQSPHNAKAHAALGQALSSVFGDKQKAQAEIMRLVNSGSLPERVGQKFKTFFDGTATDMTVAESTELLAAIRDYHLKNIDKVREQYKSFGVLTPEEMDFVTNKRPESTETKSKPVPKIGGQEVAVGTVATDAKGRKAVWTGKGWQAVKDN